MKRRSDIIIKFVLYFVLIFFFFISNNYVAYSGSIKEQKFNTNRILFGSCFRQQLNLNPWPSLIKKNPDVYVWMGDNVYADYLLEAVEEFYDNLSLIITNPWRFVNSTFRKVYEAKSLPADPDRLKEAYANLTESPGYKAFKEMPNLKIVGTWDDHDLGVDGANKNYKYLKESKEIFLNFIGEEKRSKRYSSEYHGIYDLVNMKFANNTVAIFLLDTRYNKDPWDTIDGDVLGEQQWKWFEESLNNSTADINIIVSSIQVFSENRLPIECWSLFPHAKKRLLNIILNSKASSPIILSGDVHFAEFAGLRCQPYGMKLNRNLGVPILEITSSGITHSVDTLPGPISTILGNTLKFYFPSPASLIDHKNGHRLIYTGVNFGELEIMWNPLYGKDWKELSTNKNLTNTVLSIYEKLHDYINEIASCAQFKMHVEMLDMIYILMKNKLNMHNAQQLFSVFLIDWNKLSNKDNNYESYLPINNIIDKYYKFNNPSSFVMFDEDAFLLQSFNNESSANGEQMSAPVCPSPLHPSIINLTLFLRSALFFGKYKKTLPSSICEVSTTNMKLRNEGIPPKILGKIRGWLIVCILDAQTGKCVKKKVVNTLYLTPKYYLNKMRGNNNLSTDDYSDKNIEWDCLAWNGKQSYFFFYTCFSIACFTFVSLLIFILLFFLYILYTGLVYFFRRIICLFLLYYATCITVFFLLFLLYYAACMIF